MISSKNCPNNENEYDEVPASKNKSIPRTTKELFHSTWSNIIKIIRIVLFKSWLRFIWLFHATIYWMTILILTFYRFIWSKFYFTAFMTLTRSTWTTLFKFFITFCLDITLFKNDKCWEYPANKQEINWDDNCSKNSKSLYGHNGAKIVGKECNTCCTWSNEHCLRSSF